MHACTPCFLSLPPSFPPISPLLFITEDRSELHVQYSSFPLTILHIIMYLCQCYSLNSSHHPFPLTVSTGLFSYLRLYSCLANRFLSTCLLRNLYTGQEVTVKTRHGTIDWLKIEKGVCQGYILSPCSFNLYPEYIMWNAGLDEVQAGIRIAGRNISNLRYTDNSTLMTESKEELKSLLMKVKRRVKKLA